MKIKNVRIMVIGLMVCAIPIMLAGCKADDVSVKVYDKEGNQQMEFVVSENTNELDKSNESSTNNSEKELNKEKTMQDSKRSVVGVSSGLINGENEHALVVTGYDSNGNTVWKFKTKGTQYAAQWEDQELIHTGNNRVYINDCGTIKALNKQTGAVIWENKDYGGAGTVYEFDDYDTLYLGGSDGPALCVIDFNGKTKKKMESLPSEFYEGKGKDAIEINHIQVSNSKGEIYLYYNVCGDDNYTEDDNVVAILDINNYNLKNVYTMREFQSHNN